MTDVNLNNTHCIINKTRMTYTESINICNGKTVEIPHGAGDYVGMGLIILVTIIFAMVVFFFGSMAKAIWKDGM